MLERLLSLFFRFNGHFPDEPGLAGVYWAKNDGGGGDNSTTGAISRAKRQSNHHHQQTNIQFFLYRPDAPPVAQPAVSKHWRETRKTPLRKPNHGEGIVSIEPRPKSVWLSWFICILSLFNWMICLYCLPALLYILHTSMARYSLFVLKVLLNNKQTNIETNINHAWFVKLRDCGGFHN